MSRPATDLDERDEEELLLIVSGLGMPQEGEDGMSEYWVGDECSDCVADLQRYLRRDDPHVMATHRAVGAWRVLQTHLLPILCSPSTDTRLAFSVLKLVVKLTMKPEQIGSKILDQLKDKKTPDPYLGKQMQARQRPPRAALGAISSRNAHTLAPEPLSRPRRSSSRTTARTSARSRARRTWRCSSGCWRVRSPRRRACAPRRSRWSSS